MQKVDDFLYKFEFVLSGIFFLGMVALTIVNVFCRLFLSKTLIWAEEITYMCFNWSVFIGICMVYKNQGLVSVGAIVDRLPEKGKRIVMMFVYGLVCVLNICMVVWGTQLTIQGMKRFTAALHLSYFWIDLSVPVGFIQLSYYSIRFFFMNLRGEKIEEAALEERS